MKVGAPGGSTQTPRGVLGILNAAHPIFSGAQDHPCAPAVLIPKPEKAQAGPHNALPRGRGSARYRRAGCLALPVPQPDRIIRKYRHKCQNSREQPLSGPVGWVWETIQHDPQDGLSKADPMAMRPKAGQARNLGTTHAQSTTALPCIHRHRPYAGLAHPFLQ